MNSHSLLELGVGEPTYNPSIGEAEAGGLPQAQGQSELHEFQVSMG